MNRNNRSIIEGQGPAVLAAGTGRILFDFFFFWGGGGVGGGHFLNFNGILPGNGKVNFFLGGGGGGRCIFL